MKNTDEYLMTGFAQVLLGDSVIVPMLLLRRYRSWFLDEHSLIILLRIIGPLLKNGQIRSVEIAGEFRIAPEDVLALVQPLLDNHMLSSERGGRVYRCPGLMRSLYEGWLEDQAVPESVPQEAGTTDSKERLRRISRLYRRFEVDFGRSLKYSENEKIREWVDEDQFSPELIEEALGRAVMQGKGNFAYVDSILCNWQRKGFSTLEQVREQDHKPEKQVSKTSVKSSALDRVLEEIEEEIR